MGHARRNAPASEAGFTLVESLVAMLVLTVGVLGALAMVDLANSTTRGTLQRERATTLARELLERARQVPFAQHGAAGFTPSVLAALPDGATTTATSATTFALRRSGTEYRVTLASCKHDDRLDGIGAHDATYCDFGETGPGTPPPGAPTGSAVTLKLLGIPVPVGAGGALVDSTVCGLLGANPLGSVPLLDTLLGRGGAVNRVLELVDSGAELGLCPSGSATTRFALDRDPADFSKVTARVEWTSGRRTLALTQSTMVANPAGT